VYLFCGYTIPRSISLEAEACLVIGANSTGDMVRLIFYERLRKVTILGLFQPFFA